MAFTACSNCKKVGVIWDDDDIIFGNHAARTQAEIGLPCRDCFAEMKIVMNQDTPETCKHGRPLTWNCRECEKTKREKENEELKKINEIRRAIKLDKLQDQLKKIKGDTI